MTNLFDQENAVSTELVEHPMGSSEALSPILIYSRAVENNVSAESLEKISALVERWENNEAATDYGHALAEFQAVCPRIKKERQIDLGGGKGPLYASYDDIDEIVRPLLARFRLSKSFPVAEVTEAGQMRVVCAIRHGRHSELTEVTVPVPSQMRVNDTQKMAAAISYAKRYALCDALDIVVTDEDQDGEGLIEKISEAQYGTLEDWVELLKTTPFKLPPFLKWLNVSKLSDIAAADFNKAATELAAQARKHGVAK